MKTVQNHILAADIGGTHIGLAIIADRGEGKFEPLLHKTFRSAETRDFSALLSSFFEESPRHLTSRVRKACIDFAGPIGPKRDRAFVTNLGWGFTARQVFRAIPIDELVLLNDFEAVGFGLEVLLANAPSAFVRLSPRGKLPPIGRNKPTAVVIGAGTGLGTCILIEDATTGRYRPLPGEGGHVDFVAAEESEFRIAQWIRLHANRSAKNPLDCEKIVSGPGLANVFHALSELEPKLGKKSIIQSILSAAVRERAALIVANAGKDRLCREALDTWLRCYARAAKNSAIFPLAPGGIFLAGGIAAKILPEMKSGVFMKEFLRCDMPNIRDLLVRTPVFVVTDYRISLFGCANVVANFSHEFALHRKK